MSHQSSKLTELESRLRERGLPVTVQRRAILQSLENRTDHPTADQVFAGVRKRIPAVSRTTVYRVLDTFVQVGVVRKVDHPGSATRYDPRVDRHHHLICTQCGRMADVEDSGKQRVELPPEKDSGFEIQGYSIQYTGVCAPCRKRVKSTKNRVR